MLDFYPQSEPQVDFIVFGVDDHKIESLLTGLGATRRVGTGYVAYVWNRRLTGCFMAGIGVLDHGLTIGPKVLSSLPRHRGAGAYVTVNLEPQEASVEPDPFGMYKVYFSSNFVSSSLHVAALIQKRIDVDNAVSVFYNTGGFSFSFNTFKTPVADVELLPVGGAVLVRDGTVSVSLKDQPEFTPVGVDEYWELIARGAREIVANVEGVVRSGVHVFTDLSGGRDSRLVYAAVVAAGLQNGVVLNTIPNPSSPGLEADLNIASGLAAKYGGSYSERPAPSGYAQYTVRENLARRRSQVFGSYHWIVPSDIRPVCSVSRSATIRMLGGGGELYREYYRPMLFQTMHPDGSASPEELVKLLCQYRDKSLGALYFDRYIGDLLDTFDRLPGQLMGEKWDAHYLGFRLRYTFGPKQASMESMIPINVVTVPSLLRAARGIPTSDRAAGRVLYDVINTLVPGMANDEFDSPNDPAIFASKYHRETGKGNVSIPLDYKPDLVLNVKENRRLPRPIAPRGEEWDFNSVLDSETRESLEICRTEGNLFEFLRDPRVDKLVSWARDHSPRNRSALASKLRSFADYSEVIGF